MSHIRLRPIMLSDMLLHVGLLPIMLLSDLLLRVRLAHILRLSGLLLRVRLMRILLLVRIRLEVGRLLSVRSVHALLSIGRPAHVLLSSVRVWSRPVLPRLEYCTHLLDQLVCQGTRIVVNHRHKIRQLTWKAITRLIAKRCEHAIWSPNEEFEERDDAPSVVGWGGLDSHYKDMEQLAHVDKIPAGNRRFFVAGHLGPGQQCLHDIRHTRFERPRLDGYRIEHCRYDTERHVKRASSPRKPPANGFHKPHYRDPAAVLDTLVWALLRKVEKDL